MPDPAPGAGFSLLAASAADLRREGLADALGRALGMETEEAAEALRRSGGILGEGLPRGEAERVAGILREASAAFLVLPDGEVAAPAALEQASRVALVPEGLDVRFPGGDGVRIGWDRIAVIALGSWQETVTVRKYRRAEGPSGVEVLARAGVVGLPLALALGAGASRKPARRSVRRTEFRNVLDLLLIDPGERLRIEGDGSCGLAGLGENRAPTTLGNLRALAAALAAAVPAAGRSAGLERFLAGEHPPETGYGDEREFLREQRWLAALRGAASEE
ncbi:MAG: hypothetical protein L6R43_11665 [Planctomycetes bacterium]|nr:hypothetical protein [Planctomycetota bacterium]